METVLDQVCASCGSECMADGRFCLFCGDLLSPLTAASAQKGALVQRVSSPEYAGFWLRFWAGSIDVGIETLGALLVTFALDFLLQRFGRLLGIDPWDSKVFAGVAFILIWAVGSWLYCAFTESSSWRATIGKRLFGLQVTTINGERISFGQATARHFMKFLSLFCLAIGFLMSGWTKRRQALHDMPCDAIVIRAPQPDYSLLSR